MDKLLKRFTIGLMIAGFVGSMAFVPATVFAGQDAKKATGKGDISASSSSDSEKKAEEKAADKKKEAGKKHAK